MSKNIYDLYLMDRQLEQDGVPINYGDACIWIARAGGSNSLYRKACARILGPKQADIEAGIITDEEDNRLMAEIYAESIIIKWENVKDKDGNLLDLTRENIIKVLLDLPELFADIKRVATSLNYYRDGFIKESVKN